MGKTRLFNAPKGAKRRGCRRNTFGAFVRKTRAHFGRLHALGDRAMQGRVRPVAARAIVVYHHLPGACVIFWLTMRAAVSGPPPVA